MADLEARLYCISLKNKWNLFVSMSGDHAQQPHHNLATGTVQHIRSLAGYAFSSALQSERQPLRTGYPSCVCGGCISALRQGCYHIPRSQVPLWASRARGGQLPKLLIQRLLVCPGPRMTELHGCCKESESDWVTRLKGIPCKITAGLWLFQRSSVCVCVRVCLWRFRGGRDDIVYVCLVHSSMRACICERQSGSF